MVLVPCIAAFFKLLECLILAMYELTMKDSNFPTVYIKQLSNCAKVFQYCNLWTKSPCSVDSSRHQVTAHQCIHLNLITYLWSLPCFRIKAYSLDVTELIFSFPTQSRFLLQSSAHFALLANSFISGFLFFFSLTNSIILNYEPISALVNDKMHFSLFTRLCIYQSRSSCEYSYPWWFLSSIQQIWVPWLVHFEIWCVLYSQAKQ